MVTSWGILRRWSPFGQRPRPSRRGVVGVVEGLEEEGGGEEEEEEGYEGESTMGGDFSDVDYVMLTCCFVLFVLPQSPDQFQLREYSALAECIHDHIISLLSTSLIIVTCTYMYM